MSFDPRTIAGGQTCRAQYTDIHSSLGADLPPGLVASALRRTLICSRPSRFRPPTLSASSKSSMPTSVGLTVLALPILPEQPAFDANGTHHDLGRVVRLKPTLVGRDLERPRDGLDPGQDVGDRGLWAPPPGRDQPDRLLQVSERGPGTGHARGCYSRRRVGPAEWEGAVPAATD